MKKVVITGCTGLIGLALIKKCIQHNCKCYAIARPESKRLSVLPKSKYVQIIECDLSNLSNLDKLITDKCDVFYHLGWGHTGKSKYSDVKYQTENINFTIDAVRIAQKLGCRLFVGAGSQAEYGPLNLDVIEPESPANPMISYGICKYAAGKLAAIEADKLGITFVWVRIFSTYGFNDKKDMLLGSIIEKMMNDEHISMTAGIQQWDYLFCEDAGRAFYLIGEKCNRSTTYCLGSGEKRPLKDYISIIASKLNYKKEIGYGEIPYNSSSVMNLCADISKLKKDVGFKPTYSFEEGISLYIRDYKKILKNEK